MRIAERLDRFARVAILVFLVAALPLALLGQGERSGFLAMTSPAEESHAPNVLLGYAATLGPLPFHHENVPALDQVVLFSGTPRTVPINLYSRRPIYGLAAALLQPLAGIPGALVLANVLGWALAAWAAFRLASDAAQDRLAGLVAAALASLGAGFALHAGDYSAHLLSFAFYYAGVAVVHASGVWREARPFRTHLVLGLGLGVACLQYNTGICLVAGYVAVALRRNRWWHVALAAAIALAAERTWLLQLGVLDRWLNGTRVALEATAAEKLYLARSLEGYRAAAAQGPGELASLVARRALEFAGVESPLVLLGALGVALVRVRSERAWFTAAFALSPLGAGMVFANAATARGYLVYGATILAFAALGGAFARGLRSAGRKRWLARGLLALVLLLQLAWASEHLRGRPGVAKWYFLGTAPAARLVAAPPRVLSLTGSEPVPTIMGGDGTLQDAGLAVAPPGHEPGPAPRALLRALFATSYFLLWFVPLAGVALATWRARARAWGAIGVVWVVGAFLGTRTLERVPRTRAFDHALAVPAGRSLRTEVTLSAAFAEELARSLGAGDVLELLHRSERPSRAAGPAPRAWLGGEELALERVDGARFRAPAARALELLRRTRTLAVALDAGEEPLLVTAWQRSGLAGRSARIGAEDAPLTPALELRVRRADGSLVLAGF